MLFTFKIVRTHTDFELAPFSLTCWLLEVQSPPCKSTRQSLRVIGLMRFQTRSRSCELRLEKICFIITTEDVAVFDDGRESSYHFGSQCDDLNLLDMRKIQMPQPIFHSSLRLILHGLVRRKVFIIKYVRTPTQVRPRLSCTSVAF